MQRDGAPVSLGGGHKTSLQVYAFGGRAQTSFCSADFQVCRVADFQIGTPRKVITGAGLEACGTADLEVCATAKALDKS